ncbi:MAG TPA: citryl-CoA lyase [Gemmatimonadaceae bacterium]
MTDRKKARAVTKICEFDSDRIMIRGRSLVDDIMGNYSFSELLILQALGRQPTKLQSRIVDAVLVTIMEHGLVPSAVVTRLTLSGAPESFQGAVAAGLLGVGDRYAGTAAECGAMLERIVAVPVPERPAASRQEVMACRQMHRPVPGFGHPIHHAKDPRVKRLLDIAKEAGAGGAFIDAMELLADSVREGLAKPLVTNISAAIAAVLGEADIPARMMRGIVLTARCGGLVGHVLEEMDSPLADDMWLAAKAAVESPD